MSAFGKLFLGTSAMFGVGGIPALTISVLQNDKLNKHIETIKDKENRFDDVAIKLLRTRKEVEKIALEKDIALTKAEMVEQEKEKEIEQIKLEAYRATNILKGEVAATKLESNFQIAKAEQEFKNKLKEFTKENDGLDYENALILLALTETPHDFSIKIADKGKSMCSFQYNNPEVISQYPKCTAEDINWFNSQIFSKFK